MGSRSDKPRLLKVKLLTTSQQRNLLAHSNKIKDVQWARDQKVFIRKSLTQGERKNDQELRSKMVNRINELKKQNPNQTYVIYASKICSKAADGSKPSPISDPLNITQQTNSNFVPLKRRRSTFQSTQSMDQ